MAGRPGPHPLSPALAMPSRRRHVPSAGRSPALDLAKSQIRQLKRGGKRDTKIRNPLRRRRGEVQPRQFALSSGCDDSQHIRLLAIVFLPPGACVRPGGWYSIPLGLLRCPSGLAHRGRAGQGARLCPPRWLGSVDLAPPTEPRRSSMRRNTSLMKWIVSESFDALALMRHNPRHGCRSSRGAPGSRGSRRYSCDCSYDGRGPERSV